MANLITIFRTLLIFLAIYPLFGTHAHGFLIGLLLVIAAFSLDGVDGYVARKYNEASKLGAVLDIMSDRIIENTLWVTFAVLGWLPIAFPLVALTRGFVVDGLRSVAMEQGMTAFGDSSMQKNKIGSFICSSKFSRISYAVAKALAFVLMIVAKTPGLEHNLSMLLTAIAYWMAVIAIAFCVLRGLPVIFESKELFAQR